MSYQFNIHITSQKILTIFSVISMGFLIIYYLPYLFDIEYNYFIRDYMNITQEKNVPTFFSFMIMILISLVYLLIYKDKKQYSWLLISLFFLYLGFDDMFKIHENIGSNVGQIVVKEGLDKEFTSYYWQAVFMPLFALFGLFIIYVTSKAFVEIVCKKCLLMLFAGFGLYAIAVGMDFYEGMDSDFFWLLEIFETLDYDDVVDLMRATEEAIEMLGGTLILASLLRLKEIKISIS